MCVLNCGRSGVNDIHLTFFVKYSLYAKYKDNYRVKDHFYFCKNTFFLINAKKTTKNFAALNVFTTE